MHNSMFLAKTAHIVY